jgi:hypothetical protein
MAEGLGVAAAKRGEVDEATRARRAAQARWYADGIAELVGGFILAVVGIALVASTFGAREVYAAIALGAMIVAFPMSARAVRFVKGRFAGERTADVDPPAPLGWWRIAAGAVIAAALAAYAVRTSSVAFEGTIGRVMLVLLGVTLASTLALRARRLELPRFYAYAGVVAAACAISLLVGAGFVAGAGAMWIGHGVASMLMGATVFAEYLTANPATEADAP